MKLQASIVTRCKQVYYTTYERNRALYRRNTISESSVDLSFVFPDNLCK